MNGEDIPAEVRQFLAGNIHSLSGLESLLLLHKNPGRGWLATEVASELRVDPKWVEAELEGFCRKGLVSHAEKSPPQFFYAPASTELASIIERLAQIYPERRVTIIQLIFAPPADPIKTFADAFDLRKGKSNG
jgi:hypothetical protein